MRKLFLSSAGLTAVLAIALTMSTSIASASNAKEVFREMKAAMKKSHYSVTLTATMTADNQVTVTTDGGPKGIATATVSRNGDKVNVDVTIDLDESHYSKIAFGKDKSTLLLTPKTSADRQFEVAVEPKSKFPKSWTTYKVKGSTKEKIDEYDFTKTSG